MCSGGEKGSRMPNGGGAQARTPFSHPCPESPGTRGRRHCPSARQVGHKAQSAWRLDAPPAHHSEATGTGYPGPGPAGDGASLGRELLPWVPGPHTAHPPDKPRPLGVQSALAAWPPNPGFGREMPILLPGGTRSSGSAGR